MTCPSCGHEVPRTHFCVRCGEPSGTGTSTPAGRDFATGLGSPNVWNLARDLVADEQAHGCSP